MFHSAKSAKETKYSYCEALLRRDDPDRWLASLFLPGDLRPHIHALYAFSHEIARVREVASEPLLGEIRFQWWRDAIEAAAAEEGHPVAAALTETVARFNLPKTVLLELIEARQFDLYDEPMPSVEALEAYARATSSSLFRLAPMILDPEEQADGLGAAEHGGVAYAFTGLLRALPWHSAKGQVYLPADLLAKHDLQPSDVVYGRGGPALLAALGDLRALASRHLEIFHAKIGALPLRSRAPFLPVSLCQTYLAAMEKPDYDPYRTVIELPQWRRQWILWRAAKRWA